MEWKHIVLISSTFIVGVAILGVAIMTVPKSTKRNIIVGVGVLFLAVSLVLLIIWSILSSKTHSGPSTPPKPQQDFNYKNKGMKNPPVDGIGARDGFNKKVDWWFLIKLPTKMMNPDQIQHSRLLPKDYLPNKPHAIYDDTPMGTMFTRGYITHSTEPSMEFIQNWAPEAEMYIHGEYKITEGSPKLKNLSQYLQLWLGLASVSPDSASPLIKVEQSKSGGNFTITNPKDTKWNEGIKDPSDRVVSVNLWRAWLRIKQALNFNDVVKVPYKPGITDDYVDITSNLVEVGMENNIKVLLGTYVSKSGIPYDYSKCGESVGSFGAVPPNYDGGVLQCAHCICNGNDASSVYNDMPCLRVDKSGKSMKCWSQSDRKTLLDLVHDYTLNNKSYPLLTKAHNYNNCLTNWLVSQLDGGVLDKKTVEKACDEVNKILETYYKSGNKLYDPIGNICFFPHSKTGPTGPTGPKGHHHKEKYTKAPPKPPVIPFAQGPHCQSALDKDSPVNYFFPEWAKDENGVAHAYAKNRIKRGSGVCYVYADSSNPTPKYFRSVTNKKGDKVLDPLGQGYNDPVSQTLNQLFNSYRKPHVHWSFWTDQMYQSGDSYYGTAGSKTGPEFDLQNPYANPLPGDGSESGTVYSHKGAGCSAPGAHSKGVVCSTEEGGFWMSTSIPMYPDFSFAGIGEHIKLGCQLDNNVSFAQHMFCCSLNGKYIQRMLIHLKDIMSCGLQSPTCKVNTFGGFNYGYGIDTNYIMEKQKRLNMYQCSSIQGHEDPEDITEKDLFWRELLESAGSFEYSPTGKSQISKLSTSVNKINIQVIAKASADTRPPWAIVANFLKTDLSVSGWWDNLNGTPSYCAGRDYTHSTNQLCLNSYSDIEDKSSLSLLSKNSPKYNVERIIGMTVNDIPNPAYPTHPSHGKEVSKTISRSFMQYGKLWYVGNHAKWGISTPRNTKNPHLVVFGDMNGGGYPASQKCDANQFGRGGLFFAIENEELHQALVKMIELVCACNPSGDDSNNFCGWGGYPGPLNSDNTSDDPTYGRIDSWDRFAVLPTGSSSGTFWCDPDKEGCDSPKNKAWTRWKPSL